MDSFKARAGMGLAGLENDGHSPGHQSSGGNNNNNERSRVDN